MTNFSKSVDQDVSVNEGETGLTLSDAAPLPSLPSLSIHLMKQRASNHKHTNWNRKSDTAHFCSSDWWAAQIAGRLQQDGQPMCWGEVKVTIPIDWKIFLSEMKKRWKEREREKSLRESIDSVLNERSLVNELFTDTENYYPTITTLHDIRPESRIQTLKLIFKNVRKSKITASTGL